MTEHSRRIVITGVSRGLGLALVERFDQLGHTIVGCARSREAIDALRKRWDAKHSFSVVDVSRDDDVARWAREVDSVEQPADLLINNAAAINRNAPLWEVPAAEFAALTATNINGVANVIRHFVPPMVARGRGVIVNLSSGWGRSVSAGVAPYCATKWAIEGLTKALAEELPKGMAAVPVNPGIIDTAMLRSCFGGDAAGYPSAETWAEAAADFLLALGPRDNGQSRTV